MQCLNDPGFSALRQAKKARLRSAGFSADRVALIDKDGACRLCLETGPDGFSLLIIRKSGVIEVKSWTQEQERYAKQDLRSGEATAAWIMYAQKRCACCGEKPAEQQPDWDSAHGLSSSLAIRL
jgi:hypothetical protein